ncbi:putative DNA-binding transcriptional regulator YafY [Thermocatellispora tengchongensis]|uniref:Putative DNA-binding transcriptional regulator YafY n=1 Tax=Thermocatellispora tengchongensis TaxID=1073253 RepID=A0A840PJB0_9ACTN|nr:HTH domain-containing protein [Thermocatellispora tengchongensis]MBB5137650.1 putative DNA-binding transcriptional regulator YafY [Thermocatellispora tengchongensis]
MTPSNRPAPSPDQQHLVLRRVERQHALIEVLRARAPRTTSGRLLAERLGVAVRTVERDIARLRAAGVPIKVRPGPGGGYALDTRPSLAPIALTPGEAAALVVALVAVGPYASASARSAMDKLLSALHAPEAPARRRGAPPEGPVTPVTR